MPYHVIFFKLLGNYVIFTKSSSQKANENSLLRKSFLDPNRYQPNTNLAVLKSVKIAKLLKKALFVKKLMQPNTSNVKEVLT